MHILTKPQTFGIGQFLPCLLALLVINLSHGCKPAVLEIVEVPVRINIIEGLPSGARGLVYDPSPALENLRLNISGIGPGNASLPPQPLDPAAGQLDLWLVPGTWHLEVVAKDEADKVYLIGNREISVHPVFGYAGSITLRPMTGFGALSIQYHPPNDVALDSSWQLELSDPEGEVRLAWTDGLGSPVRLLDQVPCSYYILHCRIIDQSTPVYGASHLVRVLADYTTTVSLAPVILTQQVSGLFAFEAHKPWTCSITMLSRAPVRGFRLFLQASGPAPANYWWFTGAQALGQGTLLELDTGTMAGAGTIDLLGFNSNGAGAASLDLHIRQATVIGDYACYTRLCPLTEPGAQALPQVAEMAGTPDGNRLAVLSDATYSALDIWTIDPVNKEARLASSSAIRFEGSKRRATRLAMSGQGRWLAVANSESNWLSILELTSDGNILVTAEFKGGTAMPGEFNYLRGLAFNAEGTRLYVLANTSRTIYGFSLQGGQWQWTESLELDGQACGVLSTLRDLTISQSGEVMAVLAAGSNAVVFFDLTDTGLQWRGQARPADGFSELRYPQAACFLPGSTLLAVSCRDNSSIQFLDYGNSAAIATNAEIRQSDGLPAEAAQSLCAGDTEGVLVAATKGGLIVIETEPADGKPVVHAVFASDHDGLPLIPTGVGRLGSWLFAGHKASQSMLQFGRPKSP